jgi:hypothetical protein
MLRILACVCLALAGPAPLLAQELPFAHMAPPESVAITRDVAFDSSTATPLKFDLYRPATSERRDAPVLILLNAGRAIPFYASWARYAASRGVDVIVPDTRYESFTRDLDALLAYLATRPAEVSVNAERLAVYAPSGVAFQALPAVGDPARAAVKAAVIYYGAAEVTTFRPDLPVLLVRAGLDRPDLNRRIDAMVATALSANAPVTVINHAAGYHSFEMTNLDDMSREVMDRTLDFIDKATEPAYQAVLRRHQAEIVAAGHMTGGRYAEAASMYGELVRARPDEARLRLAHVEALLEARQFDAACAEADNLKGRGLGARDVGLPSARACMQKGDPDAAIAWLKTIPTRFLPPSVQSEAVFAPLKARADFLALFPAR